MKLPFPAWTLKRVDDSIAIIAIAVTIATALTAFEHTTGLPASVRSDPTYGSLTLPMYKESAPDPIVDEREVQFKERLCERVVRRFANDNTMWSRVIERVTNRFGFSCSR